MNPLKIKCHRCQDVLTDGEMRTHFFKVKGSKPTCWQCSQKIIDERMQDYMDQREDERFRWGEPQADDSGESVISGYTGGKI